MPLIFHLCPVIFINSFIPANVAGLVVALSPGVRCRSKTRHITLLLGALFVGSSSIQQGKAARVLIPNLEYTSLSFITTYEYLESIGNSNTFLDTALLFCGTLPS